jgi:hypothetical protein
MQLRKLSRMTVFGKIVYWIFKKATMRTERMGIGTQISRSTQRRNFLQSSFLFRQFQRCILYDEANLRYEEDEDHNRHRQGFEEYPECFRLCAPDQLISACRQKKEACHALREDHPTLWFHWYHVFHDMLQPGLPPPTDRRSG